METLVMLQHQLKTCKYIDLIIISKVLNIIHKQVSMAHICIRITSGPIDKKNKYFQFYEFWKYSLREK